MKFISNSAHLVSLFASAREKTWPGTLCLDGQRRWNRAVVSVTPGTEGGRALAISRPDTALTGYIAYTHCLNPLSVPCGASRVIP